MFMTSDNIRIRMMLCIVLATAMVLLASGCGTKSPEETIGTEDQNHITTTTLDENPLDISIPSVDKPDENSQPDTITGGLKIDDIDTPEPENSPSVDPPADTNDKPSPSTTPQQQENTVANNPASEPADDKLVRVLDYIPSIYVELKYATEDNFTGKVVYDFADAQLRYGTVKKLAEVQTELLAQGYSLKIWDAYRPVDAQFKLWEICPDPVYVANPNTGYSSHSRGNTVDVTLVLTDGTEIKMPTGFDDFSTLADRNYSDIPADATENVLILESMMKDCGFNCYSGEWWHYSDSITYSVVQ